MVMAATGIKQQQQPTTTPAVAVAAVDPKYEWAEKEGSYVLRLTLTGFRKDDFRVEVDDARRLLAVRGATRPGAACPGSSLHKVFKLPATASHQDIAGRLVADVLTLTVPKRAASDGAAREHGMPPPPIEEIIEPTKPTTPGAGGMRRRRHAAPGRAAL